MQARTAVRLGGESVDPLGALYERPAFDRIARRAVVADPQP